jgi:hypothetical protein
VQHAATNWASAVRTATRCPGLRARAPTSEGLFATSRALIIAAKPCRAASLLLNRVAACSGLLVAARLICVAVCSQPCCPRFIVLLSRFAVCFAQPFAVAACLILRGLIRVAACSAVLSRCFILLLSCVDRCSFLASLAVAVAVAACACAALLLLAGYCYCSLRAAGGPPST